jgi:hypothetical protein
MTTIKPNAILAEIRTTFPHPISANDHEISLEKYEISREKSYCVLGAALRYFDADTRCRFPEPKDAAKDLRISLTSAQSIAKANDAGDFETAWKLLGYALDNLTR